MIRRWAIGAVFVVAVASCGWPMASHGSDRRASSPFAPFTPADAHRVAPSWSRPVPGPVGEVIGDFGSAFVRGAGVVAAFWADGAPRWSAPFPGTHAPALVDADLFVPIDGRTCGLSKVAAATGAVLIGRTLGLADPGTGLSVCEAGPVVVDDDTVIVPWRHSKTAVAACGPRWTVANGITAYDRHDLTTRWYTRDLLHGCDRPPTLPHSLQQVSRVGDVYVATPVAPGSGEPAVAYPTTGCRPGAPCTPLWTTANASSAWVGTPDDIAARVGDAVEALDPGSGTRWRSPDPTVDPAAAVTADPAYDDVHLFAPSASTGSATLAAYRRAGCGTPVCGPAWSVALPSPADQRPSVAGTIVAVVTTDRHLVLIDAACSAPCAPLATLRLTAVPTGPPAIIGGRILVGTTNGVETFALPA